MIRVLNVLSSLDGGGVEMMLYNYYSHMDSSKIKFDFIAHNPNEGMLETSLIKLGSTISHVTPKHKSLFKNIIEIDNIIKNGHYDIVQCHQNFSCFTTLLSARLRGVKVRVAHSHGNDPATSLLTMLRNASFRIMNRLGANYFFACGEGAGKWLFGKKWTATSYHGMIINNAIDTNRFKYNQIIRNQMREENKLRGKVVLLHIGRFSPEKNHKFIIDLFEKLQQQQPKKYVLIFAGSGSLLEEIKEYTDSKGLSKQVHFLGNRTDIAELLNMSDIFLLPSLHEGFPVTLIEAQSTGICVLASAQITRETKLTDRIVYLPLDDSLKWIEMIRGYRDCSRDGYNVHIQKKGFDIVRASKKYQNHLIALCAGRGPE